MSELWQLQDKIRQCSLCDLCKNNPQGTMPVPGKGPKDARIMLIGECPGIDEVYAETPFIGRCGKLLRKTLSENKINPDDCYITNVAKCVSRKGNKNIPLSKVAQKTCASEWLKKEIELVKPQVIMTLGQVPLDAIMRLFPDHEIFDYASSKKVSDVVYASAGLEISRKVRYGDNYSRVMPNFHPAYILRGNKDHLQKFQWQIRLMKGKLS